MKTWNERFKAMKKELGYSNADIAEITGLSVDTIKNQTQPNKEFSRSLRLAIVVFEKLSENN